MAKTNLVIPEAAVPRSQEDAFNWLRLIRSDRVGPVTFVRLINEFGSAQAALEALPDIATKAGVEKYQLADTQKIRSEIRQAKALGARLLFLGTQHYPSQLLDLNDPPAALWALGNVDLLASPMIALVGARNASAVGTRMTTKLAKELGELGYVVVSGLARGIDAAAHAASLETGTVAVQAGGIDVTYPKENAELTLKIAESGLRLSEMPLGLAPKARHFPRRNRIISGLAKAVVVVEGASRSGSLITAKGALDQGRDVMAVPGSPLDPRASGCNLLIREGASLVRSAADIHEALAPTASTPERRFEGSQERSPVGHSYSRLPEYVLDLLSTAPISEDELIRRVGAPATHVMSVLAELDVVGQIIRQPGGLVTKAVA